MFHSRIVLCGIATFGSRRLETCPFRCSLYSSFSSVPTAYVLRTRTEKYLGHAHSFVHYELFLHSVEPSSAHPQLQRMFSKPCHILPQNPVAVHLPYVVPGRQVVTHRHLIVATDDISILTRSRCKHPQPCIRMRFLR